MFSVRFSANSLLPSSVQDMQPFYLLLCQQDKFCQPYGHKQYRQIQARHIPDSPGIFSEQILQPFHDTIVYGKDQNTKPAHMRTDLIRPYPGFFSRFFPKIHVQKPLQKKIGCRDLKEHSPKTLSQSLVTDDIGFNDQE